MNATATLSPVTVLVDGSTPTSTVAGGVAAMLFDIYDAGDVVRPVASSCWVDWSTDSSSRSNRTFWLPPGFSRVSPLHRTPPIRLLPCRLVRKRLLRPPACQRHREHQGGTGARAIAACRQSYPEAARDAEARDSWKGRPLPFCLQSPYAASDRGRTACSMSLSLVCRATRSS